MNMAAELTPPRSQRNLSAFKRSHPNSPSFGTPNNKPKPKKNKEDEPEEEKISLKDVYDLVKQMKSDLNTKYSAIAEKVEALEKQLSAVEEKLTEKLKREAEKMKKSIEEDLNISFQMLEDGLNGKMALLDKTMEAHNNLEQYTRKNSVRLFGVKELDDGATSETAESRAIKEHLQIELNEDEIEIAHRVGKYKPEGKLDCKKARPVLIKFLSHKSKEKVMKQKRRFKGSDYWITEDLTSINAEKLKSLNELRKAGKIKNAWSTDGKIRVRRLNDSVVTVTSVEDIKLLARE